MDQAYVPPLQQGKNSAEMLPQATYARTITPSDSANLPDIGTGGMLVYIGGAGNLSVDTMAGQTAVVFTGLLAGTILPVVVKRVRSTSTTATNLIALR